jgi:class 3 adenylate cyclase
MTPYAICGTGLTVNAKFCAECGSPIALAGNQAEYKQVTVLFADVVRSMDLAAAVGAERLREVMAEFFDICVVVVQRFGGTVDKFTGDGIMAMSRNDFLAFLAFRQPMTIRRVCPRNGRGNMESLVRNDAQKGCEAGINADLSDFPSVADLKSMCWGHPVCIDALDSRRH